MPRNAREGCSSLRSLAKGSEYLIECGIHDEYMYRMLEKNADAGESRGRLENARKDFSIVERLCRMPP